MTTRFEAEAHQYQRRQAEALEEISDALDRIASALSRAPGNAAEQTLAEAVARGIAPVEEALTPLARSFLPGGANTEVRRMEDPA